MFDAVSYVMGKKDGEGQVQLSGESEYVFYDSSDDGDIVISKKGDDNNG